jgi:preprotein translocase subunit SecG
MKKILFLNLAILFLTFSSLLIYYFPMQLLSTVMPYVQVVLAVLLMGGILLQQRGAGLGGAFGADSTFGYNTRRGAEKIIFEATIILSVLFVASTVITLIIK